MSELLWWVFASLAVGGAAGTVLSRGPVASLLSLVLTFFSLAALYILLGAHFIGAIQVIVYAGAIMVLFLFVIMLLNLGHEYRPDMRKGAGLVAGFAAIGVMGYMIMRLVRDGATGFSDAAGALGSAGAGAAAQAAGSAPGAPQAANAVAVIAEPMFQDFLIPFELTSILLLVAVVGAVLLAKRRV